MVFPREYHTYADDKLMALIGERDQRAFEALYDRYAKLLFNYFHRMLRKDREKARDFTQELFAKLIAKPHLYDPARPFKTWIYSIAHNMCKNEYAKHEVRTNVHEELKYTMNSTDQNRADQGMDRAAFTAQLSEALGELDEVKRTTFELRFYQDMSILEISEIMQCSEGTVKSRLFYTLKELNKRLKVFEGMLGLLWTLILFQP